MQEHTIQVRIQVTNFKLGIIHSSRKRKGNLRTRLATWWRPRFLRPNFTSCLVN